MKHLFYILVGVFLLLSLGVRAQETRKKELLRELVKSPKILPVLLFCMSCRWLQSISHWFGFIISTS